jgi:hypothetical protein
MKALGCLLTLVLTAACSGGSGTARVTQSPSSPAPAISPSSGTPTGNLSDLACRLPINSPTSSPNEPSGGWVTFPGGDFARDPASLSGRLSAHVPSYDRALSRWVPVEYAYVAPDGASYILHNDTSLPDNGFYLVDVKTGTRKFALTGAGPPRAPGSWTLIEYAQEGVYLWSTGIATVPGLWLLEPMTGAVRLIDGSHYWSEVAGGAAWALDPAGGAPSSTYRIYRLDLGSGAVTTWYEGSTPIRLLSPTPDGDVLVSYGEYGSGRLELLSSPNELMPLDVPPDFPQIDDAFLATPGVWLPFPQNGLALYERAHGVRVMSRTVSVFSVAGGCS